MEPTAMLTFVHVDKLDDVDSEFSEVFVGPTAFNRGADAGVNESRSLDCHPTSIGYSPATKGFVLVIVSESTTTRVGVVTILAQMVLDMIIIPL
jgi:hypothetical protein